MKAKTVTLVTIVTLIILGVAGWLFFMPKSTPPTDGTKQTDNTGPTVRLNIPQSSLDLALKDKLLKLSVDAKDNGTVVKVEYLLDDKVAARSIESPFTVTIDIANLAPGKHTIQAIAYDAAGNSGKSEVFTFTIEEGEVTPADDTSEGIVEQSVIISQGRRSNVTTAHQSSSNGNTGSTDPGDSDGGDDPDPDPDPEPEPERTAGGWYATLPTKMQVCSNDGWNDGPSTAPADAIVVPAGNNSGFNFEQANKVFWFAPGEHTLGTDPDGLGQIRPGNNSTYIGAPGAIIDGKYINKYAFAGFATNVRVAYLEIRNFGVDLSDPDVDNPVNNNEGVINHDAGDGWIMEHLYAHHNDGAAVFMGSDNTVTNNCLKDNGQYGFSMFKMPADGVSAIKDIVIDTNEISGNNQDNWEVLEPGCGCTGAGKFWDVEGATVTNNYVHGNLSTGLWADTNDIDFLFDSNWIEQNAGEGIWYEISYNATISRNVIKRNAWTSGQSNTGSPGAAVYISESGGESRLQSSVSGSNNLRINNNLFDNNFSGVSIYENSNRFCNSNGNTSKGYCTPFVHPTLIPEPHNFVYPNPISNTHPCYTDIGSAPYTTDCRWHSKNIKVFENEFHYDPTIIPCAGTYCGAQALYATGANNIPWAPPAYTVSNVQNNVMFNNGNVFSNNKYFGNWRFAKGSGETISFYTWRNAPFSQDNGSTYQSTPIANYLDANTSTLEGGIGQWVNWFSTTVTRSNAQAHTGAYSLQVALDGGSWATQLNNFPGFTTRGGDKRISFWAKQGSGAISTVSLRAKWFDSSGTLLQTDVAPISTLTTSWQQGVADVTAPDAAETVFLELFSSSGSAGNTLFADDFIVGDR
jgi:hypothetical protein